MDVVAPDRLIEGDGTAETSWRSWLPAAALPEKSLSQLLPLNARLVVVAPHPDDEVLACGGLMAGHAIRGGDTLVVAVTDGEASHAGSTGHCASQLADTRRGESAEGMRRLGAVASNVVRLRLPDSGVGAHAEDLTRVLTRLLLPSDVVVSTWRLDGHPDHEATGDAAANACASARCRLLEAPVWMWHWAAPGDARVPWHRLVAMRLAPETVRRKQAALAAHATQLQWRGADQPPVLGVSIVERAARVSEYFFS